MFVVLLKEKLSATVVALCHSMVSIFLHSSIVEVLHLLVSPVCFFEGLQLICSEFRRSSAICFSLVLSEFLVVELLNALGIMNSETSCSESLPANAT